MKKASTQKIHRKNYSHLSNYHQFLHGSTEIITSILYVRAKKDT